ncbi:hypothetical protein FA15DRAFT_662837 [Coprinopsis marcescibilis]|uniref:Integral membrane protein n=1 Tax=Coprinopsis marcescibilis TaxID=230819 RepID=A0A5C3LD86_COPMA|nr:hypothetical protein FA15DRAFT_662837 [Coprinopsis marcescibilis]
MNASKKQIHPLLAKYLTQLALHPLRTKALTTGTVCILQEVIGSHLAGVPAKTTKGSPAVIQVLESVHINLKAVNMGIYGFLVSAPLSHVLVGQLQKAFAGKDSPAAKVGQILANNLLVAPVQTAAFLASMAVINGATSLDTIIKTIRGGFFSVIRISWLVSPISLTIAQKFIPVELWVPFFTAVQFVLGTYFNFRVKKLQLAAARKKEQDKKDEDKSS